MPWTYVSLVTSCDDLSCSTNEICEMVGSTFQCVCNGDYEGDDCQELGKLF